MIEIYTDGACSGNPGPGGWAALLIYMHHRKEISGAAKLTTNNQMELKAVIEALKIIKKPSQITIHTDSIYVKDGITKWINDWKKNGWKNSNKKTVKNLDLWQELDSLALKHQIIWKWVKGHSGNKNNELVDQLARNAITTLAAPNLL